MKPRMLAIDADIMELAKEIIHTHALLKAYSFLSPHATIFDGLYQEWLQLQHQELELIREHEAVIARAIVVDDGLDFLCTAISSTILASNGGNRKAPEYARYYGDLPPSKLKRPILGRQLGTMRKWPPSLTQPDNAPALREYGTQLAQQVPLGDQAEAAMAESERKNADFEIGPRKKFVDNLNAARHVLHGNLAEIPLKRPELMLHRNFAHRFFLRTQRNNNNLTIVDVEKLLFRLGEQVRRYEAMLAQLLEEEEAAAQAAENEELAAAETALAELDIEREQVAARVATLQAQRNADKKK